MPARRRFLPIAAVALAAVMAPAARGEVRPAGVFTDNMVLQQELPIAVWGRADPGEEVTVSLAGQSAGAKTGDDGRWRLSLPAMKADGRTHRLAIRGTNVVTLENVVVGEVWLCGGQSNMNRGVEIKDAHPGLRLFWIDFSTVPRREGFGATAGWVEASPAGLAAAAPISEGRFKGKPRKQFPEVGYVFGRRIHGELGVPVGLIKAAVGGSTVQSWTPRPDIGEAYPFGKAVEGSYLGHKEGLLYQSMIHGLVPLAMRGVLWYQGEDNGRDEQYHLHMKQWIESWRRLWNRPDMPVYFVQIAPTTYAGGRMQFIWEAQSWVMHHVPHTAMAVSNDIYLHGRFPPEEVVGEEGTLHKKRSPSNPHPPNKHVVAERLAAIALVRTYGRPGRTLFGPMVASHTVDGRTVRIRFKYTGSGLVTRDGRPPTWFRVAAELPKDQRTASDYHNWKRMEFVPAEAEIVGNDTVLVHVPERVKAPAYLGFAWHPIAVHNLMNKEGLPAVSFRLTLTDDAACRLPESAQ